MAIMHQRHQVIFMTLMQEIRGLNEKLKIEILHIKSSVHFIVPTS